MKVSVIIRTKNEDEWIGRVLTAVTHQDYLDKELIVVDTGSTDNTLAEIEKFDVRLIHYEGDYFPGKALNLGTQNATGEYIAYLSAHCIPVNDKWIERLLVNFHDESVAGVYGRQEPLPDSTDVDKRDLWTVFGKERKVQAEDFFFHNANSMVRRAVWENYHFSEDLPSLEDQEWARKIISIGQTIVYEPNASVHHYHGIHQNLDPKRANRVVEVIELLKQSGKPW